MAAMTFIAGVVMTLAFHELDLIRSRDASGQFRLRSPSLGMAMLMISLGIIGMAMMGGK